MCIRDSINAEYGRLRGVKMMEVAIARVMHSTPAEELSIWYQSMTFFTVIGVLLHVVYHFGISKDGGGNGFASVISSAIFLVNWVGLHCHPTGLHYFSVGTLAGACAGYELYACLNEVNHLSRGVVRKDMIAHHSLCVVFIVLTGYTFQQLPEADVKYWMFVWDSVAITLASNVALNIRTLVMASSKQKRLERTAREEALQQSDATLAFKSDAQWRSLDVDISRLSNKLKVANVVFSIHFLVVRVFEQVPFGLAAWKLIESMRSTGSSPFDQTGTGIVMGAWVLLSLLNLVWAFKVVMLVFRSVTAVKDIKDKKA
eukprot:TRINITY_DN1989_c0_g1_i1.p1 TRINITY_DN1989_c0_g1~~TRINITY_DN1989_c0_g1_i1.p1  ORF type:complete len:315 (+),score=76.57 TRINITY_DN1989_c0_g1_i1:141-1085(+)